MDIQDGTAKFQTRTKISKEEVNALLKDLCIDAGDTLILSDSVAAYAGYITGGGTLVNFLIPVNKVIRANKATVTNLTMRIRQNGNYIWGAAGYWAPVDDALIDTVTILPSGIFIRLKMGKDISKPNNDSITVEIGGTFNFA